MGWHTARVVRPWRIIAPQPETAMTLHRPPTARPSPTRPSGWRATAAALLVAPALLLAPGLGLAKDSVRPGEVLMKLQSSSQFAALQARYQLTLLGQFGARPIYRTRVPAGQDSKTVIKALLLEPGVLVAEQNVDHEAPESRKNNPWVFGSEAQYQGQWAPAALRLAEAHAVTTGAGVRVAVLDTGIDRLHPALAGKVLPGHDFVDGDADPAEGGSAANGAWGHGTHVAGLVALAAPGASILPLRVLDPDGFGNTWVLQEAMLYAMDPDGNPATADGAHVINLSLGTTTRTRLFYAMADLYTCSLPPVGTPPSKELDFNDPGYDVDRQRCAGSPGAVLTAAAGNSGSDKPREYPAAESANGKLSVGASTATRRLADFSNRGSKVDLAAPGEAITSTLPGGLWGTWSGTSMAAPLTAGTAALLRAQHPSWSPDKLVKRIDDTTARLCGTDLRQVDAGAALTGRLARVTCR